MTAEPVRYRWRVGVAACAFAAIIAEVPATVVAALQDEPIGLRRIAGELVRWLTWGAVFAPLVYGAAYRLGDRRRGGLWLVLAALPVMLVYAATAQMLLTALFAQRGESFALALLTSGLFQPVIVYTLTAGYGLFTREEERRVAAERARLAAEEQFAAAQIEMLRSDLQPHFLFNALNTVSALASSDPARAASIAEKLRDLFRSSIGSHLPQVTSVEREVAFTRRYLDIQQARFEERLRVAFSIEAGLERARVPSLLLQPLVENTVRHGMGRRKGVTVDVEITRLAGELRLRVVNDGTPDRRPVVEGVGLSNTRARLQALYGERASLKARRRDEGGFIVEIRIPLEMEETA